MALKEISFLQTVHNFFTRLSNKKSNVYIYIYPGVTSRTTAMLTYYNDNREEIECIFVLPLDARSPVVELELAIEGNYMYSELVSG